MNATQKYCQRIKSACQLPSDYALAKALEVTRQEVSHYQTGRSMFSVRVAFRAAELLKIDAREIVSAVQLDRAKSDADRAFWQRAATMAASILLGGVFGLQPAPANAFSGFGGNSPDIHYPGKRTRRGR